MSRNKVAFDASRPVFVTKFGALYHCHCLQLMKNMNAGSVDCIFADPPFNLGKDYQNGSNDDLSEDEYLHWSYLWIDECTRVLAKGGSLFIYCLPKWAFLFASHVNSKLSFRHWIATNMKSTYRRGRRLYPAHYAILYFTKGEPKVFNRLRISRPRCRKCHAYIRDYGGHRKYLKVRGLNLSDFWGDTSPARLGFASRMHETHQMNASDPVNVLLNYGYAVLESQCRKALNSVGLEPTVGFLHEARQTKYPLVYDFQEPYRWIVDTTAVSCLESGWFGKKDFYRMDNYVLRLRPEAARKLLDALRIRFNSPVRYAGKLYSWDTVIRLKAQELANHALDKRIDLDFSKPKPALHRTDSEAIRNRILSMTTVEGRKLGIRRNTLWYLEHRARGDKTFRIYGKVRTKLSQPMT